MAALEGEARRVGVRVGEGDRWDDLVLRILAERIERTWARDDRPS